MLRGDSYLQENVLLNDKFHVQIADFGLTRLSEATNTRSGALHLNLQHQSYWSTPMTPRLEERKCQTFMHLDAFVMK